MKRKIRIEDDTAYIPLTRGYEALIDVEDVHLVEKFSWCINPQGRTIYAQSCQWIGGGKYKVYLLHRIIMGSPKGFEIDHKNGNGLDNRRDNLRIVTHAQNMINRCKHKRNTSGHTGVSFYTKNGKWRAKISHHGKTKHLGYFLSIDDAANAYYKAANELNGEFVRKQI